MKHRIAVLSMALALAGGISYGATRAKAPATQADESVTLSVTEADGTYTVCLSTQTTRAMAGEGVVYEARTTCHPLSQAQVDQIAGR